MLQVHTRASLKVTSILMVSYTNWLSLVVIKTRHAHRSDQYTLTLLHGETAAHCVLVATDEPVGVSPWHLLKRLIVCVPNYWTLRLSVDGKVAVEPRPKRPGVNPGKDRLFMHLKGSIFRDG